MPISSVPWPQIRLAALRISLLGLNAVILSALERIDAASSIQADESSATPRQPSTVGPGLNPTWFDLVVRCPEDLSAGRTPGPRAQWYHGNCRGEDAGGGLRRVSVQPVRGERASWQLGFPT
jgi:hypothetical protein